ncbi:MAG: HAMP domain-containing sensor histidine kinase [Bdellovibrionales bacterium]|jgi:signal transduction histidine kinase|nr:HAMP domain-containing sensor histidine kinase [Bdellovibrionales bacterium]
MPMRSKVLASELFKGFVEHSVIGMVAFEQIEDRYEALFTNARGLEILELKKATGWGALDMCPGVVRADRRAYDVLCPEMLKRDGMHSEVLLKKANGHKFLASIGVKNLEIEGRRITLLSFQDITIEKKLSREIQAKKREIDRAYAVLLEQNAQLKLLDQAKDKFIALTTHELRTPVSAIMATADVLALKIYESEEQKEEFIRTISEQSRVLLELVNDVLDFAKIQAGKFEFFIEEIEIKTELRRQASHFVSLAEQAKIDMRMEIEDGPDACWADTVRITEVIGNVLSNAIKYNRQGGTVWIRLYEYVNAQGVRFARVAVRDTGIGIAADKMAVVFNEFETVGHVSRHHKGTGLGMPISLRLIRAMGGELSLTSEVGVGSEFFIDIPMEKVLAESFYRSRTSEDDRMIA